MKRFKDLFEADVPANTSGASGDPSSTQSPVVDPDKAIQYKNSNKKVAKYIVKSNPSIPSLVRRKPI